MLLSPISRTVVQQFLQLIGPYTLCFSPARCPICCTNTYQESTGRGKSRVNVLGLPRAWENDNLFQQHEQGHDLAHLPSSSHTFSYIPEKSGALRARDAMWLSKLHSSLFCVCDEVLGVAYIRLTRRLFFFPLDISFSFCLQKCITRSRTR